uniref:Uncharacterized protein n=1 Tax=Zea mays TaxID=4577 RepID=A0A804N6Y4_MAIZE
MRKRRRVDGAAPAARGLLCLPGRLPHRRRGALCPGLPPHLPPRLPRPLGHARPPHLPALPDAAPPPPAAARLPLPLSLLCQRWTLLLS